MGANKPKRQHFIPQSYLRPFAVEENGKFFVESKLKGEESIKKVSIKDICVDKNIYTLPFLKDEEKYKIEHFYAQHVDSVYPDVYKILVNESIININQQDKERIILTTMSLFFRTPKFLNNNIREINGLLKYASLHWQDKDGNVKVKHKEHDFTFHIDEIENVREGLKIKKKIEFLKEHISDWHEFTKSKITTPLAVFKFNEPKLITCDSPVYIHSTKDIELNIFSPNSVVHLPLDEKHVLFIYPNTLGPADNEIHRSGRDEWYYKQINYRSEENCIDWIIGKPGTIQQHIIDQKNITLLTEEEELAVATRKIEEVKNMQELLHLMSTYGASHAYSKQKAKQIKQNQLLKDNNELQAMADKIINL